MNTQRTMSGSYDFLERELSLLQIEVKNYEREEKELKDSNQVVRMKLKHYLHLLKHSELRVVELEKENKKLRKRLRPSFLRRMINKLKGYRKL